MLKKTKEKVACVFLIVGGVALCIAGIWFPPVLVLGGGMLAGGLTVLSNYLQDKDRFTVNNNYSYVDKPPHMRMHIIKATVKEKKAALFAFKNRKYAMHQENVEHKEEPVELPEDIKKQLDRINELFNSVDMESIMKTAAQYNLAQKGETKPIDNDNHPKA